MRRFKDEVVGGAFGAEGSRFNDRDLRCIRTREAGVGVVLTLIFHSGLSSLSKDSEKPSTAASLSVYIGENTFMKLRTEFTAKKRESGNATPLLPKSLTLHYNIQPTAPPREQKTTNSESNNLRMAYSLP